MRHYNGLTDILTPEQRSYNMSLIRSRDTGPEMRVRRILHAAGLRYRLYGKDLPGKPDLVFRPRRTVVFVHGCFWHMHDCPHGKRAPKTNRKFWSDKRRANAKRDKRNRAELTDGGWRVFEIWECEIKNAEILRVKLEEVIEYLTR